MSIPFPSPVETARLIIRFPEPEDYEVLNAAILETWEGLNKWMPWAIAPPSLEESLQVCTTMSAKCAEGTDFPLFGFRRDTGDFVLAGGTHVMNTAIPSYEIGYWCRKRYEGQGYVTEAVQAMTATLFGHMGANRVYIRCDSRNDRSQAVALRCGYILEGEHLHDDRDNAGGLRNTRFYSRIS